MPNSLENGKYNPNLVCFNKFQKIFLSVFSVFIVSNKEDYPSHDYPSDAKLLRGSVDTLRI